MPTALEGARRSTPPAELVSTHDSEALLGLITAWLDDAKAEKVVAIDIRGKSSIAEQLQGKLRDAGHGRVRIEGRPQCDWVLIDAGDIIAHVFRPEVREFYNP